MKKTIKTIVFCGGVLTLASCGNTENKQSVKINTAEEVKQELKQTVDIADASFKDGMTGKVFHNYLQVKMALVKSDADGGKEAASNMSEAFTDERVELKTLAQQISETNDLEIQRALFSEFTNKVTPLIEENLAKGTIYKKFCPMALEGGAYWLSDIEEINNPYFGDKMLRCGKVENEIKK